MYSVSTMLLILVASIALIIVLIMKARMSAFLALILACLFLGIATGMPLGKIAGSIEAGMGGTLGFLATILALGTILGKMLEVSGGAERLALTLIKAFGQSRAHWAMMVVGFLAGLPVFFQVGFVLLLPLIFSVALEAKMSLAKIGISVVAGLITVHCVVPPHPAAMAITGTLHADVGRVILYGILVGLPAAAIAGPIYGSIISKWVKLNPPEHLFSSKRIPEEKLPPFGTTLFTILLPLLLMVGKTGAELIFPKDASFMPYVAFIGNPITALLISTFLAYWTLGFSRGLTKEDLLKLSEGSFGPIAGIMLIIGAGGAFNKVILDSGMGKVIGEVLTNMGMSPLIMAWVIAIAMRFSVGSATVAMMTSAGIILPVLTASPGLDPALVCVAVGAGAIGLSHVNDSGLWIVKEFFGMSLPDTFKTWTASTTIAAVVGLIGTLILSKIVM
jgi:gluconate:H+ symporter, GntP family